ncbi:MAG: type IV conjugative transfer system protein TraL [Gammaproteobacteria bacterium]
MKENSFYIPQYLDEPERILLWTVDEALAFIVPFMVGLLVGYQTTGLVLGAISMIAIKKFKSHQGQAHYRRWLYWYFPSRLANVKATPPSEIREYLG